MSIGWYFLVVAMAVVDKYVALLEAKVPSSHLVGCVDHNIFGVNNEVLAETQKHILLLMGIAELTPYPKASNLADAIHLWACQKLGELVGLCLSYQRRHQGCLLSHVGGHLMVIEGLVVGQAPYSQAMLTFQRDQGITGRHRDLVSCLCSSPHLSKT